MAPPIATSSLNGSHEAGDVARNGVKRAAHESSLDAFHASSTHDAMHTEAEYAAHNYHPLPVVFSRAKGCTVWDPEGNSYLDFVCIPIDIVISFCIDSREALSVFSRQPRPLPSGAHQNDDGAGTAPDVEQPGFLQRRLPPLCRACDQDVWIRHGTANVHGYV